MITNTKHRSVFVTLALCAALILGAHRPAAAQKEWAKAPVTHYSDFSTDVEISSVAAPSVYANNAPFTITVTNMGSAPSPEQKLSVTLLPYIEGAQGRATTQVQIIPALQPNQSRTFIFFVADCDADELIGNIYLNSVLRASFRFWSCP